MKFAIHTFISNELVNATKEKENFTIKEAGVKDKKEKMPFYSCRWKIIPL